MKHNTQIAVLILIHIIQTTTVIIKTAKIMHPSYLLTFSSYYSKVAITSSAAAGILLLLHTIL